MLQKISVKATTTLQMKIGNYSALERVPLSEVNAMDELERLKATQKVLEDVLDILRDWDISEYVKEEVNE